MAADTKRADYLFGLWFGLLFGLAWAIILGYQVLTWLRTAEWPELLIWDEWARLGLHIGSTGWIGLDKIIWWFLALPLSSVPFLLSAFGFLGAWGTYADDRQQQRWLNELRRHK